LIASAIYLIFANLSQDSSKNKISAYSAFNKDGRRIAGTLDPKQFENELRHRREQAKLHDEEEETEDQEEETGLKEHYRRKSKAANKPCICGSGKKYKHCCSLLTLNESKAKKEMEEWEKEWT